MEIKEILELLPNPKLLITLFKERNALEKERRPDPYFRVNYSEKGRELFDKAKTPAERTQFFYEYLCGLRDWKDSKGKPSGELLYKLAYIMANQIYGSSVEFGSFPDILDEKKNSVLQYLYKLDFNETSDVVWSGLLSVELFGIEKPFSDNEKPFKGLTYCCEKEEFSDRYKLERYVCGAYCLNKDDVLMPPYVYDIVDSNIKSEEDSDDCDK